MASIDQITATLQLADAYYIELTEAMYANDIDCGDGDPSFLLYLLELCTQIRSDIDFDINDDTTTALYEKLLTAIGQFTGASLPVDPDVIIPGETIVVVPAGEEIRQTSVVFPITDTDSYTFEELIGNEVLTVYRGTGTTLRAHASSPTNEFAQFDDTTGEITVSYPFSDGESLWVEYKITL